MFETQKIEPEKAGLNSVNRYSRKQRRKAPFVLLNERGQVARWNKDKKTAEFENVKSFKSMPAYSFKSILDMWQAIGMPEGYKVRMIAKDPSGNFILK